MAGKYGPLSGSFAGGSLPRSLAGGLLVRSMASLSYGSESALSVLSWVVGCGSLVEVDGTVTVPLATRNCARLDCRLAGASKGRR